ncbi:MAG: hypothetical protein ACRCSK_01615, partial [Fusobacteriaceae bacterium]
SSSIISSPVSGLIAMTSSGTVSSAVAVAGTISPGAAGSVEEHPTVRNNTKINKNKYFFILHLTLKPFLFFTFI